MYQGKYVDPNYTKKKHPPAAVEVTPAGTPNEMPAETEQTPSNAPAKTKKRASRGTVVFYTIYSVCVALVLIALLWLMVPLNDWLVRFEASQPEQQCSEVFNIVFADPDWAIIYDLAGVEDTTFEDKDAYVSYMSQKVASAKNPELTYMETSAGLSGDRKYVVNLDDEKVATFTLVGSTNAETELQEWKLGTVEVFFERTQSITVERLPEHTVFINDVALDDSYTIRSEFTKVEEYLPEGIHGYRMQQQSVTGLLMPPETVYVVDANGNDVPLIYDEAANTYRLDLPAAAEMTEEERTLALDAAKANALFAIRSISTGELRKHFDPNSQIYTDIINTPTFMQSYSKYSFDESVTSVSEFFRYSDDLFSAKVILKLDVTRTNGTVKSLEMNTTYFFTKNAAGNYLVTQITNVPVQERVEQVRLNFIQEGQQVGSLMVATDAETLTLPQIRPPEGQVLLGWAKQVDDGNGQITMTILFTPTDGDVVQIPAGEIQEPMNLYAVFENEGAVE